MSDDKLVQIQELIETAASSLKTASVLLRGITGVADTGRERHASRAGAMGSGEISGKVIEGVFDGQNMVDANGETYPVPANYASKRLSVKHIEVGGY